MKHMKHKGFTLMEILGVLVVISLLLLLIIPTIINRTSDYKDDALSSQEQVIYQASDLYLDENIEKFPNTPGNIYCVTLKQLIATGKLVDPVKKLVEDGNYDENTTVQIMISNNAVRTHKIVNKGECKQNITNDIVIIVDKEKIWAQSKVVTIYYPKLDGNYNNEYRINNGNWQTWNGPLTIKQNSTVEARAVGKTIVTKAKKVDKIDNVKPFVVSSLKGKWNTSTHQQAMTFVVKDMDSGIVAYSFGNKTTGPAINSKEWIKYNLPSHGGTGTITFNRPVGTYYLFLKDKAGNISIASSVKISDGVKPTCTIEKTGTVQNGWYRSNVSLKLKVSDAESGVIDYDLTKSSSASYAKNMAATQSGDTKGQTYYGFVRDAAGNVGNCSIVVKKDVTKPTCNWSGESTKWTNKTRAISVKGTDSVSGMASNSQAKSWSFSSTSKTASLSYTIKDNAGNATTCSKTAQVYVDKTPPYCGEGACDNSSNCGMYGGGWNGRTCGATYWNNIYDKDSGINRAYQRKCYMKAWGSPASWDDWGGNTCNKADADARNYLRTLGWNKAQYNNGVGKTSGRVAGGINVGYSKICYQFKVVDNAGNEKECGTHIKSNNFGTGDC